MQLDSLKKIIRVIKAQENDLSFKLKSISNQLDTLDEKILLWSDHLERIDTELKNILLAGSEIGTVMYMINQKKNLAEMLMMLHGQVNELNKEFDKIATEMKLERNKKRVFGPAALRASIPGAHCRART